jgi:hypothetical protein
LLHFLLDFGIDNKILDFVVILHNFLYFLDLFFVIFLISYLHAMIQMLLICHGRCLRNTAGGIAMEVAGFAEGVRRFCGDFLIANFVGLRG